FVFVLIVELTLLLFAVKYRNAVSRLSRASRLEPTPDLSYFPVPLTTWFSSLYIPNIPASLCPATYTCPRFERPSVIHFPPPCYGTETALSSIVSLSI